MIKKGKTRIIFTLPQSQANWLETTAKEIGVSKSRLIRWLIDKNIRNIQQWATPEEQEGLIKIARYKWMYEPDEDDD